jgi:hypothetical protein
VWRVVWRVVCDWCVAGGASSVAARVWRTLTAGMSLCTQHPSTPLNCLSLRPQRSQSRRYETYLQNSDPVVLALNSFFDLECVRTLFLSTSFAHLPQGMTPHPRVAHNSRKRRPSFSPRWAAFTISVLAFLNQTPFAVLLSTWISTSNSLEPLYSDGTWL